MLGTDSADARKFDSELIRLVLVNVQMQIKGAFLPFYLTIIFCVLGVACLLIGEILVYRRFYKPRPPGMAGVAMPAQK